MDTGVQVEVVEDRGAIILNRPRALNALNTAMVQRIRSALTDFEANPDVSFVTISSSTPNVFCAGGDMRAIRQQQVAGEYERAREFFAEEYELNKAIANFPKPYVSLIEGICMGGGLGLSIYGARRFVTGDLVVAMPEGAIGFFVDVGASYFLNKLSGAIGMYLALTGARLDGMNALYAGLATHLFDRDMLARMKELSPAGNNVVRAAIENAVVPNVDCALAERRKEIDYCFTGNSLNEIMSKLSEITSDWGRKAFDAIQAASPTSTHINHALLSYTRGWSLNECLALELQIASLMIRSPDFLEGTRAMLIDKDQRPKWSPLDSSIFERAVQSYHFNSTVSAD